MWWGLFTIIAIVTSPMLLYVMWQLLKPIWFDIPPKTPHADPEMIAIQQQNDRDHQARLAAIAKSNAYYDQVLSAMRAGDYQRLDALKRPTS